MGKKVSPHHIPDVFNDDGLNSYLRKIKKFPMMSEEEELRLANKWRDEGDHLAIEKIIQSHLRLIGKIAVSFRGYGIPMHDLIAEGHIGLMQAVKGFDPNKGARFSTYATWWIRASMQDYVMRTYSMVKLGTTVGQKKLFFRLKALKEQQLEEGQVHLLPDQIKAIAKELDVKIQEVIDMDQRLTGSDYSLNAGISGVDEGEWQDWLEDERHTQEEAYAEQDEHQKRLALLTEAMKDLAPKEIDILKLRKLAEPPRTLEEIAFTLNLSRERIRQIEEKAYAKLQRTVTRMARDQRLSF